MEDRAGAVTGNDMDERQFAAQKSMEEAKRIAMEKAQQIQQRFSGQGAPSPPSSTPTFASQAAAANQDHGFTHDIDINDCKNRYYLTKGATQAEIKAETGADITTRGKYFPDRSLATTAEPALYLHISSSSKETLDKATERIEKMMNTEHESTVAPRIQYDRQSFQREPYGDRPSFGRPQRPLIFDRVQVDLEHERHFNIRAKIVGPQGAYVKHIQQTTGVRLQLKGRGSGFLEQDSGVEADEPLYIALSAPYEDRLPEAKRLVQDLLDTVSAEYERWKAARSEPVMARPQTYNTTAYGSYGAQGQPQAYQYPGYHQAMGMGTQVDPNATSTDAYAAAYQQYYAQYYAQYQQQQQTVGQEHTLDSVSPGEVTGVAASHTAVAGVSDATNTETVSSDLTGEVTATSTAVAAASDDATTSPSAANGVVPVTDPYAAYYAYYAQYHHQQQQQQQLQQQPQPQITAIEPASDSTIKNTLTSDDGGDYTAVPPPASYAPAATNAQHQQPLSNAQAYPYEYSTGDGNHYPTQVEQEPQ